MIPLTINNQESELSYAYLHSVASHAGVNCKIANRHDDNNGIDATLTSWGPFDTNSRYQEIDIKVQLKATIQRPRVQHNTLSYFFEGRERYNELTQTG
ncbi:MAG: DUF4365 domain-containing protein [Spirochaetota bacterium]